MASKKHLPFAEIYSILPRFNAQCSMLGIFDIMLLLLIFIPLFSQKNVNKIISVSLLELTEVPIWIKVMYFILIGCIVLWGIAEELIQYFSLEKAFGFSQSISQVIHSVLILLFIANMQPYGAAFSFCFLLAKGIILLKSSNKNIFCK